MPGAPFGRSPLTKYWPEITTVAVGIILLGVFHLPVVAALVISLIGYLGFMAFNYLAQRDPISTEPTVEDLSRQLTRLQNSPRLSPFRNDLSALTSVISNGLLSVPAQDQDAALKELTRVTLGETLRYTQDISELPRTPDASSQVYQNYHNLLNTSVAELTKSYAAVYGKDDAALAAQLEKSRQILEEVHQQIRMGEG